MRTLRNFLIAALALIVFAGPASADPGLATFTNTNSNGSTKVVSLGSGTLVFTFTTVLTNSIKLTLTAAVTEFCFDSNTGSTSTAGTGRVELWRAHHPDNPTDENGFLVTSLPNSNNCYDVSAGVYWLDPTASTGGATAQVTITGKAL